jgi:PhnB protein
MSTDARKELLMEFYTRVVNQGDHDLTDRLLSPTFVDHGNPPKDVEALKMFLKDLAHAFPDILLEVQELIVEGDAAAARVQVSGTHSGPFAGSPASGKHVVWTGVDVFKFDGDKIAERWNFRDLLGLFSQLGMLENPITPYICVNGASGAIEFYKKAFGAEVVERLDDEAGRVSHAELKMGNARIYLADEHPEIDFNSPTSLGGSPVLLHLSVSDPDIVFKQAVSGGAKVTRPMADQGGGLRNGKLVDPYGHTWLVSSFPGKS